MLQLIFEIAVKTYVKLMIHGTVWYFNLQCCFNYQVSLIIVTNNLGYWISFVSYILFL